MDVLKIPKIRESRLGYVVRSLDIPRKYGRPLWHMRKGTKRGSLAYFVTSCENEFFNIPLKLKLGQNISSDFMKL